MWNVERMGKFIPQQRCCIYLVNGVDTHCKSKKVRHQVIISKTNIAANFNFFHFNDRSVVNLLPSVSVKEL